MTKTTLNRKEIKYRLSAEQLAYLRAVVEANLPAGEFGTTRVSSIYLDTPERSVIARSLEKPLYKEKLRVRWYGTERLEDATCAFIELKKKLKGIVYKRRLEVTPQQANAFLGDRGTGILSPSSPWHSASESLAPEGDSIPVPLSPQIAREIDAACARGANLRPSALITCQRTSFGSDDEGALRITFDESLSASGLFSGEGRVPLLRAGEAIMEVKCLTAYPSWLVKALNHVQAYPSSFSKYGTFYKEAVNA